MSGAALRRLALAALTAGALVGCATTDEPTAGARPTLDAALARLEAEPRIGMVGVKLVTESGELDHACKRSFPTPLAALAHFTGIGRGSDAPAALSQYRATALGDDEPGEVDAVNGAFMLCRAAAVREVGLLDAGYWLYMEDLDWCHRFWDAGWKVFYEPAGTALHVTGGSSGGRRAPRQEIAFHRGMGRFYRRFDAPEHNPLVNAAVYAGIGAKLAVSLAITAARRYVPAASRYTSIGVTMGSPSCRDRAGKSTAADMELQYTSARAQPPFMARRSTSSVCACLSAGGRS